MNPREETIMQLAAEHRHANGIEFEVHAEGMEPLTPEERDLIARFEGEPVDRQHANFLEGFAAADRSSSTRHGMYVDYAQNHSAREVRTRIVFDLEMTIAMAQRVVGNILALSDMGAGRPEGVPVRAAAYYYEREFHRAHGAYVACRSAVHRYLLQDDSEMADLLEDWA